MPNPFEFPRVLSAIVPLMSGERLAAGWRSVVNEFIAFAFGHSFRGRAWLAGRGARLFPRLAPVSGALNDLAEPTAGLRRINAVGINRRALEVINCPTCKVRAAE